MRHRKVGAHRSEVTMGRTDEWVRVILPNGIGMVQIQVGLTRDNGDPCVRVDVESDTLAGFGPADDGHEYTVENGEPAPGVVFLTGQKVSTE